MEAFRSLRTAVAFLTRIPAGSDGDGERLAAATAWFGLVGLGIGALAALPFFWVPAEYAAWLSILVTVLVTGALHEDGWADTCDGVFGGHDPDSRRAIMRDSRIGSYGAIGLWLLLTGRWLLLRDLASSPWSLAAAAAFSRSAAVLLLANQRPEAVADPMAKVSSRFGGCGWGHVSVCVGVAISGSWAIFRSWIPVVLCLGVAMAIAGLGGIFLRAKLGRLSGDALGAVMVLVELGCLAGLAML